jgi:hypothetical protein
VFQASCRLTTAASVQPAVTLQKNVTSQAVTLRVPLVDPWSSEKGHLLEALSKIGVVYLHSARGSSCLPPPEYGNWQKLLAMTRYDMRSYKQRPCVARGFLRFTNREDLKRTLAGDSKQHRPDEREMFGFADNGSRATNLDWGDLEWLPAGYNALKAAVANLLEAELRPMCATEPPYERESLAAKIRDGRERWSSTRLRHCFYPNGGSCTEHTDYGLVTIQHCTDSGLEGFIGGDWCQLQPPEGAAVLFAGDMLERMTNGRTKALLHRVTLSGVAETLHKGRRVVRQSHILFLQPDSHTTVQPLAITRTGDGTDLKPVKYGDWHKEKVHLAFGLDR